MRGNDGRPDDRQDPQTSESPPVNIDERVPTHDQRRRRGANEWQVPFGRGKGDETEEEPQDSRRTKGWGPGPKETAGAGYADNGVQLEYTYETVPNQRWRTPAGGAGHNSARYARLGQKKEKVDDQFRADARYIHKKFRDIQKAQHQNDRRESELIKQRVRVIHERCILEREKKLHKINENGYPQLDDWLSKERGKLQRMQTQLDIVRKLSSKARIQVITRILQKVASGDICTKNNKFLLLLECMAQLPSEKSKRRMLERGASSEVKRVIRGIQEILEEDDNVLELERFRQQVAIDAKNVDRRRLELEEWKARLQSRNDKISKEEERLGMMLERIGTRSDKEQLALARQKAALDSQRRKLSAEDVLLEDERRKLDRLRARVVEDHDSARMARADARLQMGQLQEKKNRMKEAAMRMKMKKLKLLEQEEDLGSRKKMMRSTLSDMEAQRGAIRDTISKMNQKQTRVQSQKDQLDSQTDRLLKKFSNLELMQRKNSMKISDEWARLDAARSRIRKEKEELLDIRAGFKLERSASDDAARQRKRALDSREARVELQGFQIHKDRSTLRAMENIVNDKSTRASRAVEEVKLESRRVYLRKREQDERSEHIRLERSVNKRIVDKELRDLDHLRVSLSRQKDRVVGGRLQLDADRRDVAHQSRQAAVRSAATRAEQDRIRMKERRLEKQHKLQDAEWRAKYLRKELTTVTQDKEISTLRRRVDRAKRYLPSYALESTAGSESTPIFGRRKRWDVD